MTNKVEYRDRSWDDAETPAIDPNKLYRAKGKLQEKKLLAASANNPLAKAAGIDAMDAAAKRDSKSNFIDNILGGPKKTTRNPFAKAAR